MLNGKFHLSRLQREHPQAFARYVEMLVEDCVDEFYYDADGELHVNVVPVPCSTGMTLTWNSNPRRVNMDIGSGWEEEQE